MEEKKEKKEEAFMVYIEGIIKKYKRDNAHEIFGEIMAYIRRYCKLDEENYIIGSYAMGIKGIKQISNISVSMSIKNMGLMLEKIEKYGKLETIKTQTKGVVVRWRLDLTEYFKQNKENNDNRSEFYIEIFQNAVESGYPDDRFSYKSMKENGSIIKDLYENYYMSIQKLLEWKMELVRMNVDINKHKKDIEDINKYLEKGKNKYYMKYIKYKTKYHNLILKKELMEISAPSI